MSQPDLFINLNGQFGYHLLQINQSHLLGKGSSGSVVKATVDHIPCAAKIFHRLDYPNQFQETKGHARFELECQLLRELKHPCIVKFLGRIEIPSFHSPLLLMEMMEETLINFLEQETSSLPYYLQLNISHSVIQALTYIHDHHVIHRDLCSDNILINGGSQPKLADFGMAKIADDGNCVSLAPLTYCPGTPVYMPPEAWRYNSRYSYKLDVFSAGVLMIHIVTREYPKPTDASITVKDVSSPSEEKIIFIPEVERRKGDISKVSSNHTLLPIALQCLKDKDFERPSAADLCQRLVELKEAFGYRESERESQLHSNHCRSAQSSCNRHVSTSCLPSVEGTMPTHR